MPKRIVGIWAHPDDESFFCGGTLAQHVEDGDAVSVHILSDGVSSRPGVGPEDFKRRRAHFGKACDALGIVDRQLWDVFPDQRSDTVPQLVINRAVEKIFRIVGAPDRVYTHFREDLNIDHRRVAEAVLVATRGMCYVWACAPEWPGRSGWLDHARMEAEIHSSALAKKIAACACYEDETRLAPHPRAALATAIHEEFRGYA